MTLKLIKDKLLIGKFSLADVYFTSIAKVTEFPASNEFKITVQKMYLTRAMF